MKCSPHQPSDLADLRSLSARIGKDPLLIQGAGGNTSVKTGSTMWIKASGTLLADAMVKDIFVPIDVPAMRAAMIEDAERADQTQHFVSGERTLRPSIETSLHTVLAKRVVVHAHCVQTLAYAIRSDAEDALQSLLSTFNWCFVPYTKPGANLARQVLNRINDDTDVVILANHGLLITADTVAAAEDLLEAVVTALTSPPATPATPDKKALNSLAGSLYEVPELSDTVHQLALHTERIRMASGGSLYPDHVIFCGVGAAVLKAGQPIETQSPAPIFVIVPDKGVLLRRDASSAARALATCLGDVLLRVPVGTKLNYLTHAENGELLNWDAEKYRQAMNEH